MLLGFIISLSLLHFFFLFNLDVIPGFVIPVLVLCFDLTTVKVLTKLLHKSSLLFC